MVKLLIVISPNHTHDCGKNVIDSDMVGTTEDEVVVEFEAYDRSIDGMWIG